MSSRIVIDTSHLNKVVKGLGEFQKEMPKAYTSALNRTLDFVYTRTARYVKDHYNVGVGEIKEAMTKHKASFSRPKAFIKLRSRSFTIARFLPGGLLSKSKVAKVKIKKAAGYQRIGGSPAAFTQKVRGGNTQVFRREGKKRYPLSILRTLSPTQMVQNLEVSEKIQVEANKKLAERINHEIHYRLKKVGAK